MRWTLSFALLIALTSPAAAQPQRGFGPGPGGVGGPRRETRQLLKQFDQDNNGWLDQTERSAARKRINEERAEGGEEPRFGGPRRGSRRPGRGRGPGGRGTPQPTKPGPAVSPQDVQVFPDKTLYDTSVLRTLFLEFENEDWEEEMEDFHGTDIEVPAKLTVDGKSYPLVGVRFRGQSSYGHVPRGAKRPLNVSLDLADEQQRLYGYKTLNLLNSFGDPSMMSSVVYSHIARQHIPAPKANFVHVVINGLSWGSYVSTQQFDKTFLKENFGSSKGTRWKASGSPRADGGLRYLGDDVADYKTRFEMKSNDGKKAWKALIELCRTLNETPPDQLQSALEPILDIDGALKFLALDNALVNSDGYWTRASDYSLFRDAKGKFHVLPHDMNEAFALRGRGPGGPGPRGAGGFRPPFGERRLPGREPRPDAAGREAGRPSGPGGLQPGGPQREPGLGGPGGQTGRGGPRGRGGPGGGGVDLDPLVGLDSERMPLRSKLLAIPELRERYLQYVRQIARDSLDWNRLEPVVAGYHDLINPLVKQDTRKLDSYDAFVTATKPGDPAGERMSLQKFAIERSKFLLKQ